MSRTPASRASLRDIVSSRVGIIRELTLAARGPEEPEPPVLYHAVLSNFDFKKASAVERSAAGKGVTAEEAIGGAIGEAVERYCAAHIDLSRMHRTTLGSAPTDSIPLHDFVLYSSNQYAVPGFPFLPLSSDLQVDWIRARELPGTAAVWVPASLIYMHSDNVMPGDALCHANSNGLAAGPTVAAATRSALLELIERDAFVITWLNRLSAPEIDLNSASDTVVSIARHYARFDIRLRAFNLTTDIPAPVTLALAQDLSGRGPAVVIGLGCHLDPALALQRAVFEVCQVHPGEVHRHANSTSKAPRVFEDVRTIEDHSAFFWDPARLGELDFLLTSGRSTQLDSGPSRTGRHPEEDVDYLVRALRDAGSRVAVVELTTGDLRDFDIHVVRALATGLQPIHFGFERERLGGRRVFEVPQRCGYRETISVESELNRCPHPLA